MYHIGLIGAGQLGSRHLQALATLPLDCVVSVVDPSAQSLATARERLAQAGPAPALRQVDYCDSAARLTAPLDLAILACTADVRLQALQAVLEGPGAAYLILDKVAFQSPVEFTLAQDILQQGETRAWVNCQRRMVPLYKQLKTGIQNQSTLECRVQGGNWGLGCNAIHFIDLMAFLIGESGYTLDGSGLDEQTQQSKRPGFLEFSGTLGAVFTDGSSLVLEARSDSPEGFTIELHTQDEWLTIDEVGGEMQHWDADGRMLASQRFRLPYQSELTGPAVEQILRTGESDLTPLAESARLHQPLIETFNRHLQKVHSRPFDRCPIT